MHKPCSQSFPRTHEMNGLRFVVFDLDGVLADIDSSWQYVHRWFNTDNEENFGRYLRREIDFKEFMCLDIHLWKRAAMSTIKSILDSAPLMMGATETVQTIKERHLEPLIISSGISILADRIAEKLGIKLVYANRLISDEDGYLSGEGEEIVPLNGKDRVLREVMAKQGFGPRDCITVGDSRHDIPFFRISGLSIAFNSKDEKSKQAADVTVDGPDLRQVLPWITGQRPDKGLVSLNLGQRESEAVVISLSPDNLRVPVGLSVNVFRKGSRTILKVTSMKGVETMLATLDDLLASVELVREMISAAGSRFVPTT